jgi:uncharacterized protein (TIGR02145 family)
MTFFTQKGLSLLLVAAAFLSVGLAGCDGGGGKAELVGTWVYLFGSDKGPEKTLELFKDGTGVSDGVSLQWKIENKRLILLAAMAGLSCDYKVKGTKLILTYDDNKTAVFLNRSRFKMEHSASSFKDSRDGKKYNTVKISDQVWMAENLNFQAQTGISLCYDNENSNCDKYGRMYDWEAAKSACPSGWHLPARDEWEELVGLVDYAGGGENNAGKKLRAASGWDDNENGTDDYGFSILPGGEGYADGKFSSAGKFGYLWSATEVNDSYIYTVNIDARRTGVRWDRDKKANLANVRCIKN